MNRFLVLAALLLTVSACTSRSIIMRNPETGATTDCGSRPEMWIWDVASNPGREDFVCA